jgi:hypothetical protein
MPQTSFPLSLKKIAANLNLSLLLFLLVFTMDKVVLKFAGIGLIFLLNPDFSFRLRRIQIPLFYLFIIIFEVLKFLLLNKDFSTGHTVTFFAGCTFWGLSFLALYQIKSLLDKSTSPVIDNTLMAFFAINFVWSVGNLILAMVHSGSLNPYILEDERFGSSTGDLIKGIFLAPCYINMMVNTFFIFYFLYQRKFTFAYLAMFVAMITTSNFSNLVLLPVLVLCFIFNRNKKVRITIAGLFGIFITFYLFVTPSNLRYLRDSVLGNKKQQAELVAYQKEIAKEEADSLSMLRSSHKKRRTTQHPLQYRAENVDSILADSSMKYLTADSLHIVDLQHTFGKLLSFKETYAYLKSGAKPFLVGTGIGGYSSFLAERVSGVNRGEGSRVFNYLPEYRSAEFEKDHYQIFKTIYSLPKVFHSIKHFPNSFINQIFGEYGIIGVLLFLFTYVFFFLKRFKQLTYGRYLLLLMGGFLVFDYLFEYLSVVVMFELFMLADLKGKIENKIQNDGQPVS